ncbi:MAG: leucine-rich repeat protein [Bacteroidaceae bacterium]|nr:leucine-rich repeat protein [Bacteroidaceae bacterium]
MMNYPLISEYIEAIKAAEDNFEELNYLRPVLAADGQPVMTSGNFAVVFKMKDERDGKQYAVKCFTKEQQGREDAYRLIADELQNVVSPYIVPIKYLEKELFVDSKQTDETEFPVLLMDWVEGKTLDKYLRENLEDQYALEMLAYRLSQLAQWLIPQPFAHGDLKPDNILVREDGTLVLVDYDGMYVPAMKGQKARELGSPDFRHPLRTEDDFDEHIDDFPLVSILLSLKAISLNPQLLEEYGAADRLLFSEKDYRDISRCEVLNKLYCLEDTILDRLISLLTSTINNKYIATVFIELNQIVECNHIDKKERNTEVTNLDPEQTNTDVFGAIYTQDYSKLIQGPDCVFFNKRNGYSVRFGTKIIGNKAFFDNQDIESITIPATVTHIGDWAFRDCSRLYEIILPNSIIHVGNDVFAGCRSLRHIIIPKGSRHKFVALLPALCGLLIEDIESTVATNEEIEKGWIASPGAIYSNDRKKLLKICSEFSNISIINGTEIISNDVFGNHYEGDFFSSFSLAKSPFKKIYLPNTIRIIGYHAFGGCNSLTDIIIPNSVKYIGEWAFAGCSSLTQIVLPDSVKYIGEWAFAGCSSLTQIVLPDSVKYIGENVFSGCKLLSNATLPKSLAEIPCNMFYFCKSLSKVNIPEGVNSIGDEAFAYCESITEMCLPKGVTHIGKSSFFRCYSLTNIIVPESVIEIGEDAFEECISLSVIKLANSISKISANMFAGCTSLDNVTIPYSIKLIEHHAFYLCESLKEITIPDSVYRLEKGAFYKCRLLRKVIIKNPDIVIEELVFDDCESLMTITVPNGTKQRFLKMLPKYKKQIVEDTIIPNELKEEETKSFFYGLLSKHRD